LGNLVNLRGLYLNNNQLSGSIPPELGNLVNLQYLYLSGNQLSGGIPTALGDLTHLEYLHVDYNPLSGALPYSLMNLEDLYSFHFNDTNLCEPPDASFQAWLATIHYLQRSGLVCSVVYLPLCLH
jgi:Leucine-rich repeat (LRR) protein